jgi:hypothetical protein
MYAPVPQEFTQRHPMVRYILSLLAFPNWSTM